MDEFGSTFFDLSSSSFTLCPVSSTSNGSGASSSFSFNQDSKNSDIYEEHHGDLDSFVSIKTENRDHKDSLSSLLDNLVDDSVPCENSEPLNIESLIEQNSDTAHTASDTQSLQTNMEQPVVKTSTSVEKIVRASNVVQIKLVKKPLSVTSISSNSFIPVTVHSLSGQKHSIVHTTLPMQGPRVHLLPSFNNPLLQQTARQQVPQQADEKTRLNLSDPSQLRIVICNVVASFRVRCHLNLRQIALESFDVVYRREAQKVVMRMRKPKCTAYMWSSGKVVCTGSTSEESAKKAARKFCRRLLKIGFKIRFADFRIVNVLAVSKMPYAININDFSQAHKGKHCSYEPELHPGVTFRDASTKSTLKIFSTGSVTVTGRSVSRATDAIRNVFPLFKEFYKYDKPNADFDYNDALPSDDEDFS